MEGWEEALEDACGSRLRMGEGGGAVPFAEDGQFGRLSIGIFSGFEKDGEYVCTLNQCQA